MGELILGSLAVTILSYVGLVAMSGIMVRLCSRFSAEAKLSAPLPLP
jgi:hypothetical protein